MVVTVQIDVRELKNRITQTLRWVEAGERVAVTRRGKVVAVIEPTDEPVPVPRAWDSIY